MVHIVPLFNVCIGCIMAPRETLSITVAENWVAYKMKMVYYWYLKSAAGGEKSFSAWPSVCIRLSLCKAWHWLLKPQSAGKLLMRSGGYPSMSKRLEIVNSRSAIEVKLFPWLTGMELQPRNILEHSSPK